MRLLETAPTVVSLLVLCLSFSPALEAKTRPVPAVDSSYASALGAADRFLQAWQSGDIEGGVVLLTGHAKASATAEVVEAFFSNPGASAYEINRGKLVKPDRYEFPVVLVSSGGISKQKRIHRTFSTIVVVNTGNDGWAVDKLP